jgi:hypothetical protein
MAVALTALAATFLGAPTASALGRRLSFDEIARNGRSIVVGTVLSSSTRWGANAKMIFTDYELSVDEVWKGEPRRFLVVSFAGGTVDGKSILVSHVPRLEVGATYVLSLNDLSRPWHSPVVGAEQGLFREVTEKATGQRILLDVEGWAVTLDARGELARVGRSAPSDEPQTVILRRESQPPAAAPRATGMSTPVYSDGAGRPLEAPRSRTTLAATQDDVLSGAEPLTRGRLRDAFQRVLDRPAPAGK